ncbi:uncharacterized protein RB166_009719 [Leptodactylus fuscus]
MAQGEIRWDDRAFLLSLTIDYLLSLRRLGVSACVAQRRLAGVGFFLKLSGVDDVTRCFCVRQALKGWKREHQRDPVVLLLGHSFVYWAAQRAESRPGGSNLGFHRIQVVWRGVRGMRWSQILPEAVEFSRGVDGPVILVIHAGGNDLCFVRMAELLAVMRSDFERLPGFFSESVLVWSEIIPRVHWHGSRDAESAERCRRSVNSRMARFVRSRGGVVVRHRQLEGDNSRLLREDGVHPNDIGLDIFLSGLQDGIEQALFLLGGGRHPV